MEQEKIFAFFGLAGIACIMFAFLMGLYLVGKGILIRIGKFSPNGGKDPNSSLWTFASGMLLLMSPVVYAMTMNTFTDSWDASKAVYEIDKEQIQAMMSQGNVMLTFLPKRSVMVLTLFIYLYGLYSYLKGLYLFRYAGTMGNDGRTQIGRAWGHTAGGFLVLNIHSVSCFLVEFFVDLSYC